MSSTAACSSSSATKPSTRATCSRRPGQSPDSGATSMASSSAVRSRRTRRSSSPTGRGRDSDRSRRGPAPFPRRFSGAAFSARRSSIPSTTRQTAAGYVRDRFPNDTIPADRVRLRRVRAVLDRYPLPNVFVNGQEATANNYRPRRRTKPPTRISSASAWTTL